MSIAKVLSNETRAAVDRLLQLPPEQRLEIGERLIDSVGDDVAAAWEEEVARRIAEHEAGGGTSRPVREVIAELRESLDEAD